MEEYKIMKKKINGKMCDTESAKHLAFKFVGEFGEDHGYEENLYVTKTGQHFLYGTGGPSSPYPKAEIKLLTKEHADAWEKETKGD